MSEPAAIIDSLNATERSVLESILKSGDLSILESLYDEDYEEIPVTIDEFISNPRYLGSVYDGGDLVYPFWKDFMHKFFHENTDKAFEVAFSGAIGIGKSTIAAIMMTYIIYKTLCLKDPRKFYRLTGNSPIVFVVMNLTLDLAYQGLYTLIVENIKSSPWFLERVDIRGKYDVIIEFKEGIQLIAGSTTNHVIGKNVIAACMTGDTEILTIRGYERLDSLAGTLVPVIVSDQSVVLSPVVQTRYADELIALTLEDGTILRCTPDHRFLLKTGEYKEAQYLTIDDELEEV